MRCVSGCRSCREKKVDIVENKSGIQKSECMSARAPQGGNARRLGQRRFGDVVLQELAEVAPRAVLADHVERVAVGDAHAHHADEVRVIQASQDPRLLDEVSPASASSALSILDCEHTLSKVKLLRQLIHLSATYFNTGLRARDGACGQSLALVCFY